MLPLLAASVNDPPSSWKAQTVAHLVTIVLGMTTDSLCLREPDTLCNCAMSSWELTKTASPTSPPSGAAIAQSYAWGFSARFIQVLVPSQIFQSALNKPSPATAQVTSKAQKTQPSHERHKHTAAPSLPICVQQRPAWAVVRDAALETIMEQTAVHPPCEGTSSERNQQETEDTDQLSIVAGNLVKQADGRDSHHTSAKKCPAVDQVTRLGGMIDGANRIVPRRASTANATDVSLLPILARCAQHAFDGDTRKRVSQRLTRPNRRRQLRMNMVTRPAHIDAPLRSAPTQQALPFIPELPSRKWGWFGAPACVFLSSVVQAQTGKRSRDDWDME